MSQKSKRHVMGAACLLGLLSGLLLLPQAHSVRADHTSRLTLQAVQDHVDDLAEALDELVYYPPLTLVATPLGPLFPEDLPVFAQCPPDTKILAAHIGTTQPWEQCRLGIHQNDPDDTTSDLLVIPEQALNRAQCVFTNPGQTYDGIVPIACACIAICGP